MLDSISCQCVKNMCSTILTPLTHKSLTHQHLRLLLLCVAPDSLTVEGSGCVTQPCSRHRLALLLGQFGQVLLQQGLLPLKAEMQQSQTCLAFQGLR